MLLHFFKGDFSRIGGSTQALAHVWWDIPQHILKINYMEAWDVCMAVATNANDGN